MKTSADGDWYFSRDGQQSGPLTYANLKEKADEGILRPRSDLVWKEGMADWIPIGEVDGLFERLEASSPPPSPEFGPPPVLSDDDGLHPNHFGGCRRRSYIFVHLILPGLFAWLLTVANSTLSDSISPTIIGQVGKFGPLVLVLVIIYVGIQRFANLGMSRWWYLGHFVPILNLWTGYRSFACPEGYAAHKQMDGVGVFLAILYWLSLIFVIAVVVLVSAVLAGAAGSPEIQQHVKELMEQLRTQTQTIPK
jgi:uncharacterized membrane protein YhaH (DUF805 family)